MVLRWLATECKDGVTCASVWADDAGGSDTALRHAEPLDGYLDRTQLRLTG